jgi:quercetin dioxygenase-like cupin family protein
MTFLLLAWLLPANLVTLDNEYVRATRDATTCASASAPDCADRVIVALGDIEVASGKLRRKMSRGDIAVFAPGESYEQPIEGDFYEVVIKPNHPPVRSPSEIIPPDKNALVYDGERFFIFEEKLAPGDTRSRHSHNQRVVIQLNRTQLQQWPDGAPPVFVETVPDRATFSPPVIHVVKNVGDTPLRGIVIEFRPEGRSAALQ